MIILITGASHTGKTAFSQKLLEKYKYPYLSIDHLKMGLIRSGNTQLTPMSDDADLTAYLWPIVREMIKTAIENKQNLIVEGCYIPFDWERDFTAEYLSAKTRIDADLGAGNFRLASGYLCMPDFDLGVGKTALTATMIGEGDFDCGVGDLALTVYGAPSSYTVYANRGIGHFSVDGESVSDGDVIGSGENTLRISGGIGNVDVSFLQD